MNKVELEYKIKEIKDEAHQKILETIKEYCFSNNPYKIGDIFTDYGGNILIEKISFHNDIKNPCCVYYGIELTKNKTFKKNGKKRWAYQCNEKKRRIKCLTRILKG